MTMSSPSRWQRKVLLAGLTFCGGVALYLSATPAQEIGPPPPPPPLCKLKDDKISELSGLAASRAYPGCFWANNDSGDTARLFLVNSQGETVAIVNLEGVEARDWEDIAFAGDHIYVGDIGDNASVMDAVQVHRLHEPKLDPTKLNQLITLSANDRQTMTLRYPDVAHDAESLAATPDGRLLIVSKSKDGSNFYSLSTPFVDKGNATLKKDSADFQFGATGWLTKLTTGADFSTDGRKLAVCTYAQVYEFALDAPFDFGTLRLTDPKITNLPPLKQCESVCYSPNGKRLFVSSEGKNAPIYELESQLN